MKASPSSESLTITPSCGVVALDGQLSITPAKLRSKQRELKETRSFLGTRTSPALVPADVDATMRNFVLST